LTFSGKISHQQQHIIDQKMSDRQRPDSMLNLVELDPATNGFQMNLSNLQTLEQILLDKNWMDKKVGQINGSKGVFWLLIVFTQGTSRVERRKGFFPNKLIGYDFDGLQIVILLICGLYRSGKSFQLNLLLDAHRHGQQQLATWLGPNHRVGTAGVPFRGGSQPDTQGIRAWPEPFLIREESGGEEVVLLLLDSQVPGFWKNYWKFV
jgi:hypothetical protein